MPRKHPRDADLPSFRRALLAWHRRRGLPAPWRDSGDPYRVLVAAVMAQQTQMSRVLPKYDAFLRAFPTVESLARASTARVLRAWEGMGYNMRALRLQRAARRVVREGGFPRATTQLERIEGVGPCTAAIVASFAFGAPAPAVDTNVARVLRRVAGDDGLPEREVHAAAARMLSRRAPGRWNQALMDLGALVCTARAPQCGSCPVARWCRARKHIARRIGEGRAADATSIRHSSAGRVGAAREPPAPQGRRNTSWQSPQKKTSRPEPFAGSRRYYRGRIVQALRELPAGGSMSRAQLSTRLGVNGEAFSSLIDALSRDGLVRVGQDGRLRLP